VTTTMTTHPADELMHSLLLPDARQERHAAMKTVRLLDLTLPEVHGLLAILEPARARAAAASDTNEATVLELAKR
jgi:hypothetical protein